MSLQEPPMKIVGHIRVVAKHADGTVFYDEEIDNLLTTAGKLHFHNQCYVNTSAGTVGANFIGLSTNTDAPVVGDTTLTGEITTGGLARAVSVPTYVAGTSTTTLVKTFTATATHTAVLKVGVFNASSGGTLTNEGQLPNPVTLNDTDAVTVTWGFTFS